MTRSVSKKMGIKEGARAFLFNAPAEAAEAIDPSRLEVSTKLTGTFDYIHFSQNARQNLTRCFPG